MRRFAIMVGLALALVAGSVLAQASVTVVADLDPASATGIRPEGLVADRTGQYLFTSDLASRQLYRITVATGAVEVLGQLPQPSSGMAFDKNGWLYMASGTTVLRIPGDKLAPGAFDGARDVQGFAAGLAGANGLAFDGAGNLYVSGGATGRIYIVSTNAMTRTFASGFTSDRQAQRISTNGLAFGPDGKLYSSNTGSGGIDRITVLADGSAGAVERFVTSELLRGADGITFAANGDPYVAANERNAIVRVTPDGQVSEVASNGNSGPLEFPASPSFAGDALYVSNFDVERGANAPAAPGVGASVARIAVGVGGAPLPYAQPLPAPAPTAAAPQQPALPEQPQIPATLPNTAGESTLSTILMVLALTALVAGATLLRVRR
jgi:sugar lactone lactonase YvrE